MTQVSASQTFDQSQFDLGPVDFDSINVQFHDDDYIRGRNGVWKGLRDTQRVLPVSDLSTDTK